MSVDEISLLRNIYFPFREIIFCFAKFHKKVTNFCDQIKFLTGRDKVLNFHTFQNHQKENFYIKNPYGSGTDFSGTDPRIRIRSKIS
jgi:hypothetical protein